jgi:hypothetical protein
MRRHLVLLERILLPLAIGVGAIACTPSQSFAGVPHSDKSHHFVVAEKIKDQKKHSTKRSVAEISNSGRGTLLDVGACSALANDMLDSASGEVDYGDARSFANKANTAGDDGNGSSAPSQLARAAKAFAAKYTESTAGANKVDLYPSSQIATDCAGVGVTSIPGGSPASNATAKAALIDALQKSFNDTEPSSAFSVKLDSDNPAWAKWEVDDPNVGVAYGFAESSAGVWTVVAGPGTADVGCPPPETLAVPASILDYFNLSCDASSVPVAQVTPAEAYQIGFDRGKTMEFPSSFSSATAARFATNDCNANEYGESDLNAQYDSGCVAGYNSAEHSTSNDDGPSGQNNESGAPSSGSSNVGPSGENNASGAPSNAGAMP